jgi:HEAT repeat protein
MAGKVVWRTALIEALVFWIAGCCLSAPSRAQVPARTNSVERRAAAWAYLHDGLNHKDADNRIQAIYALGTLGVQSDSVSLIEARLQDKDSLVRQAAAKTLGDMHASQSIPNLRVVLDDKSAAVSFTAAEALWHLDDQSGTSVLAQVLAGDRGVSPGLIHSEWHDMHEQLHNPASLAEFGAVQAAGAFLGPAGFGVAALEELAKDKTAGVRALSASLLGAGTDPGDRVLLEEALKDKSWLVRAAAAEALGHVGNEADIEKLSSMVDKGQPAERYKAAAAIVRLTSQ